MISPKPERLPALTGLRGFGALWVVAFHITQGSNLPILKNGYLGVDLFFILSGFVLSHVHAADFESYSLREHVRFLQLRLARIYPLHVFVLMTFAIAVFFLPDFPRLYPNPEKFDFTHFVATLFLVHNWGIGEGGNWNIPSWSLSAEWLAYILFPFIFLGLRRSISWRFAPLLIVIMLVVMVEILNATGHPRINAMGKGGLVRMAFEFSVGCLLYQFSHDQKSANIPWKTFAWIALVLIVLSTIIPDAIAASVFGFALLIASVAMARGFVSKIFDNVCILFLGEVSFSLYLCHWPLIQVYNWIQARNDFNVGYAKGILLTVIALVAVLTWQYIEKPARDLGRRFVLQHRAGNGVHRESADARPVKLSPDHIADRVSNP